MQDFNYHTHTSRCGHADYSMSDEDFVNELVNAGIKKMAFTDHAPEKNLIDTRPRMRMSYDKKHEYLESIRKLREKYKGIIDIESGFEVEYLPGDEENLLELKSEVDKIILGQHFIYNSDKSSSRPLKIFRYQTFTHEDLITYAKYIERACEIGLVDIIAHPDLFMLARDEFTYHEEEITRMICSTAEKYKIPLEINLTEPHFYNHDKIHKISYPCKDFWKIASDYDIDVLYGIDAHFKSQIQDYKKDIHFVEDYLGEETIKKMKLIKK